MLTQGTGPQRTMSSSWVLGRVMQQARVGSQAAAKDTNGRPFRDCDRALGSLVIPDSGIGKMKVGNW